MNLQEALTLERYKLVTDRQKYFTELARDAFAAYLRFLTLLTSGAIAVVSTRKKLELRFEVVLFLVDAVLYLITFLAVVTAGQIVFCLVRWYGFRRAECEINSASPQPESWAAIYEVLYVCAIGFSALVAWRVAGQLPALLR